MVVAISRTMQWPALSNLSSILNFLSRTALLKKCRWSYFLGSLAPSPHPRFLGVGLKTRFVAGFTTEKFRPQVLASMAALPEDKKLAEVEQQLEEEVERLEQKVRLG